MGCAVCESDLSKGLGQLAQHFHGQPILKFDCLWDKDVLLGYIQNAFEIVAFTARFTIISVRPL